MSISIVKILKKCMHTPIRYICVNKVSVHKKSDRVTISMAKPNKDNKPELRNNISTKKSSLKETLGTQPTAQEHENSIILKEHPKEPLIGQEEKKKIIPEIVSEDNKVNSTVTEVVIDKEIDSSIKQEKKVEEHYIVKCENKHFCINVPKKVNKGEDSDPLLLLNANTYYVGVFDGMGGSGAAEYPSANGTHTGAYIASRQTKQVCEEYLRKNNNVNVDILKENIKTRLDDYLRTFGIRPSGLRSSIIRILPTTLALVSAEKQGKGTRIRSYWCGDSRNYIFTKSGLQQISVDDLSKPQDPLENLRNDEALSNCISQDKPFSIHEHDCGRFEEPIIIISATDGCFGYLSTPMHFEYLLLKTLAHATDCKQWKELIINELTEYSGDDFSMALIMVDESFEFWKNESSNRLQYIEKTYINKIQRMKDKIAETEKLLETSKTDLFDGITSLWEDYKINFLKI